MRRLIDILRLRVRSIFRRGAVERELERELRFHLDQRVAELVAAGHTTDAARAMAQREFGSPASIAEQCRDTRRVNFIHNVIQDLRYGARVLAAQPVLLVAATASIALGAGATLAIFGLANSLLLAKPTAGQVEELVHIRTRNGSHASYAAWQSLNQANVIAGVVGYRIERDEIWRGRDTSTSITPLIVTSNFFDVMRVPVAIGRGFTAAEADVDRNPRVAVLSDGFWKRALGGNPAVIGETLTLNGEPYTVLGIMPQGLRSLPGYGIAPDLVVPLSRGLLPTLDRPRDSHLQLIGRLHSSQSVSAATAALATVAQRIAESHGDPHGGIRYVASVGGVSQLNDAKEVALFVGVLLIVSILVLAIACANVAGLLIARGTARRREIALRLAIGASRGRLIQQLVTEGFLISLLGTIAGLLITTALAQLARRVVFELPFSIELNFVFDARMAWLSFGLIVVSTLLCGLAPALQATRRSLTPALKQERVSFAPRRFNARSLLVAGQMAVSVVLLVTTALFIRNLALAQTLSPGFDADRTLMAEVTFVAGKQAVGDAPAVLSILEQLRSLPGVETAAFAHGVPLTFHSGGETGTDVRIEGRDERVRVRYMTNSVGPRYFATMGIDLMRGRDFTTADRVGAPSVIVVNEEFVRRYFADSDPVGRHVFLPTSATEEAPFQIVGVVADSKYQSIGEDREAAVYSAALQSRAARSVNVIVRSTGEPEALVNPLRRAIMDMDDSAAVAVEPMTSAISFAFIPSRVGAILMGALGLLGNLLAMVGLYGVVSFAVSRRTSEIGVRMALGASHANVMALVLKDSGIVVGAGVVIGLAMAVVATGPLRAFLVADLPTTDPVSFILTTVSLVITSLVATIGPARRAMRVDPTLALRAE